MKRFLLVVLALLCVAVPVRSFAEDAAPKSVYELVPKDAFFFVAADDIGAYAKAFEKTPLYRIAAHPGFQKCFAEAVKMKKTFLPQIEAMFGVNPEVLLKSFTGRAFLAVFPAPPDERKIRAPHFLAAFEVPEKKAEVKQMMEALAFQLPQMNPNIKKKDVDGGVLLAFPAKPGMPPMALAYAKGFLLFGAGAAVDTFMKNPGAPEANGVLGAKNFKTCHDNIKPGKTSITVYLDVEYLFKTYMKPQMRDEKARKAAELLDLEKIKAVMLEDRIEGTGFKDTFFIHTAGKTIYTPTNKIDFKALDFIPEGANSLCVASIDLTSIYTTVDTLIRELGDNDKFAQAMKKFEQMAGLSIPDDLLGSLGPEMGYFSSNYPGTCIFAQVKDRKKFDAVFRKLAALNAAGGVETLDYKGYEITIFYPKIENIAFYFTPSYVVIDGMAFFAVSPHSLKSLINFHEKADKRLIKDDKDFAFLVKQAGKGNAGISYVKFDKIFDAFYSVLVLLMPMANSQDMLRFYPEHLPPVEDVNEGVFGVYSLTSVNDDGMRFTMYSPTGPLTAPVAMLGGVFSSGSGLQLAFISGVMAAVLVPNLMEARGKAETVETMANLNGIKVALFMYAEKEGLRYPPSLDVLVKKGFIRDRQVLYAGGGGKHKLCYNPNLLTTSRGGTPMCWSPKGAHRDRVVLTVGLMIMAVPEDGFQELLKRFKVDPALDKAAAAPVVPPKAIPMDMAERRKAIQCMSYLNAIKLGIFVYAQDNDDKYPKTLGDLHDKYVKDKKILSVPGTAQQFVYHSAASYKDDGGTPVCWTPKGVLKVRVILTVGGTIRQISDEEFGKLMKKFKLDPETGKKVSGKKKKLQGKPTQEMF